MSLPGPSCRVPRDPLDLNLVEKLLALADLEKMGSRVSAPKLRGLRPVGETRGELNEAVVRGGGHRVGGYERSGVGARNG